MAIVAHRETADHVERRTQEIGRDLFARMAGRGRIWERSWWDDRLMAWTTGEPRTKVQFFRFIDALPALRTDAEVRAHLVEYLAEAKDHVPPLIAWPLAILPRGRLGDAILGRGARWGALRMAHRFIAGSNPDEALDTVLALRSRQLGFTADLLGEAVLTDSEADAYALTCLDLLQRLSGPLGAQPEHPLIDRDDRGPIPRVNLSIKLSSLVPRFDPLSAESTMADVLRRLRPILRQARRLGAFVNVDMEQYSYKDLTLDIFEAALMEPEFRDWPHAGVVIQAYLRDSGDDLERLRDWVNRRGTPVTIRLVKGAYWDYEVLHARQLGWPVPVYERKPETDANYERCSRFLIRHGEVLRPAFGTHNLRSIAHALAAAETIGRSPRSLEFQVLHGMGGPIERALVGRGLRVRVYTPYGAMLPGMAYLVRRLLENTSNESFLRASSQQRPVVEDLLRNPEEVGSMWGRKTARNSAPSPDPGPFRNEPPTDFSREENRERMRSALAKVRASLPLDCPIRIKGYPATSTSVLESTDPGDTSRVVARAGRATPDNAHAAITVARRAFAEWSRTPVRERAEILFRAAAIMRRERFELASWEVYECAKPWREADADVAEAIDFCEFYAREMIRLGQPSHRDVPGETNASEHIARGVAVVIPPWNFPLAIPCGMTVAALVAGNTVVLKPAEQSPAMAWHLARILGEAGLPQGVLNYLPGVGEEVGPVLVEHPEVDLVSFTGSRAVGLTINRQAAETRPGQDHVKRVIAEMGGKNAILVDDDADLDEAVAGVLVSSFGYAGQKCSACSRVLIHDGIYESFLARLVEAAESLRVGPADDPATDVNALIDAEARDRVAGAVERASQEGRLVLRRDPGGLAHKGHYIGPVIVADVAPDAWIANEEVFGPVLAAIRVADLDQGLKVANSTAYALSGGLYSRSPANIERVKREFHVGNLYINRPITGTLVDRQPFGGFKLSGIGTKAGGPEYLREFLLTRVVTENTLRRGFAPEDLTAVETLAASPSG